NYYLSQQLSPSIEFDLMDIQPEPWQPADSLAIQKLFALNLGMNFNKELENVLAQGELKHSVLARLLDSKYQLEQDNHIGGKGGGSNAWVIAGQHTQSGKPILANDPHLALSIPSIWYAIAQKGGDLNVSGMSFVGLPVVVFGANQHIAWGGTNLLADVQDLVIERQHPENANLYYHQGQWLAYEVTKEVINIRADAPAALQKPIKPVTVTVRRTLNGPVISDVQSPLDAPLSLRWTALDDKDSSFEALLKVNLAQNWTDFKQALSLYHAPTLNFLYADINNNIGYVGAGSIPVRSGYDGQQPVAGWVADKQWQGFIDFDSLPREFNPKSGYIINANNQVTAKNHQFISSDWADPARANRIEQLLLGYINQQTKIDVAAVQKMQMDTKDLNGADFVSLITQLALVTDDQQMMQVLDAIKHWSGEMDADSIAPVMYVLWLK
ncbi:MAG: penicillin acylase family protein, partial [Psychrosphaera sp.]|nr:penicillin acylase family protein [Psychrosphaera sp.]